MNEKLLPIVIIVLSFGASIVYAFKGDANRAIYWFAAGVLPATVTFR